MAIPRRAGGLVIDGRHPVSPGLYQSSLGSRPACLTTRVFPSIHFQVLPPIVAEDDAFAAAGAGERGDDGRLASLLEIPTCVVLDQRWRSREAPVVGTSAVKAPWAARSSAPGRG